MTMGCRILLVEDSRPQALVMTSVLEKAGWSVTHTETAERALETLNTARPDLILIDYYLPGVRGDELCRQIRMRIDTRLVPIVILTSGDSREVELEGLESGADDFLSKASGTDILVLRLRALLAKAHSAAPSPPPVDFQSARLLAVDDSRTYLTYLTKQLESDGFRVDTASSGAEAVAIVGRADYDCILVDLVMPGMDGIEVCSRIKALGAGDGKSVTILMLTAQEDNQNLARAFEAGADDFVGKSSDIVVIKGRVRALLRRKFFEDEHRRRLSAELDAKAAEARHALAQQKAAEARAALADDLERTAIALRRSNEELQQFANVASHDLQEPLRMVSSFVQLLERQYKDKLDDRAREYIAFAVDGTHRMKTLINDLLAYSRVGTREKPPEPADCEAVLRDALKNLQASIGECGAAITHDPLPTVIADRAQLVQLLQNLVGNAVKYRGPQAPCVHISARQEGRAWVFSVRDNGIGIDKQYWDRIFIIFQRLHTAAEYPGTGIGLAICKKIIDRHGGRIWVESDPGQGATFYFSLPNTASTAEPPAALQAA
jgi:signal transduction histidine kinase